MSGWLLLVGFMYWDTSKSRATLNFNGNEDANEKRGW